MREVHKRNNLPLTQLISNKEQVTVDVNKTPVNCCPLPVTCKIAPQFCIEMEIGTGKTYVYTKIIFELHNRYGFTKFIIVVPSVAIREGVRKSFEITKEHFTVQYDNAPCQYFIYNSAKLLDVRQFATAANIEIMSINIDM